MSRENVELVRRAYEAYARGDLPAAASAYSEETVWDVSRFRPDVETHSGEELAKNIGSRRETWSEHSFSLEQAVDVGGYVVAVIKESGRGNSVRGGKIVETIVFSDPEDAFAAAGP